MARRRRGAALVGMVFALALVASACGGDDGGGNTTGGNTGTTTGATAATGASASGTIVSGTEKDGAIALDPSSVAAGDVTFDVTNKGPSVHEFVVFQTDLAEDAIPTADGLIDESAEGLTLVDEIEDIAVGATPNLTVTLDAANYVVVCNILGHYDAGMHAAFTVT